MGPIEFFVEMEQQFRQDVVYPQADRMGPLMRELELERARRKQQRPAPVCWIGARLAGAGRRLTLLGERLAARSGGAISDG